MGRRNEIRWDGITNPLQMVLAIELSTRAVTFPSSGGASAGAVSGIGIGGSDNNSDLKSLSIDTGTNNHNGNGNGFSLGDVRSIYEYTTPKMSSLKSVSESGPNFNSSQQSASAVAVTGNSTGNSTGTGSMDYDSMYEQAMMRHGNANGANAGGMPNGLDNRRFSTTSTSSTMTNATNASSMVTDSNVAKNSSNSSSSNSSSSKGGLLGFWRRGRRRQQQNPSGSNSDDNGNGNATPGASAKKSGMSTSLINDSLTRGERMIGSQISGTSTNAVAGEHGDLRLGTLLIPISNLPLEETIPRVEKWYQFDTLGNNGGASGSKVGGRGAGAGGGATPGDGLKQAPWRGIQLFYW